MISNGCYQDVRGVQNDDIDYSNSDHKKKILCDDSDEEKDIEMVKVKDDSFHSTLSDNNNSHLCKDKLTTSVIDITKIKETETVQTAYSCCM